MGDTLKQDIGRCCVQLTVRAERNVINRLYVKEKLGHFIGYCVFSRWKRQKECDRFKIVSGNGEQSLCEACALCTNAMRHCGTSPKVGAV